MENTYINSNSNDLNYLITEVEKLLVINTYKLGTRYIHGWAGIDGHHDSEECIIEINTPSDVKVSGGKSVNFNNIINKKNIDKPILVIYRNPIHKTLTGLIEDFGQSILRMQDEKEFNIVLDKLPNNIYRKLIKKITHGIKFSQKPNVKTWDYFAKLFDKEFIYDTDIRTDEVYYELFISYFKYRMETYSVSDRHAKFFCFPAYFLIKEYLDTYQDFILFDLDNDDISLSDTLQSYQKTISPEDKIIYTNKNYKSMVFEKIKNTDIWLELLNLLTTEIICYQYLQTHKNNITK